MTFISVRRLLAVCVVSVAAAAAMAAPGTASASDLLGHCEGGNVKGLGSSFQAAAEKIWTGAEGGKGFNLSPENELSCSGTLKPTAEYLQGTAEKGSGACLKAFGIKETPKYNEFPWCGTDEAPSEAGLTEVETHAEAGHEAKSVETIPVLQGAVAVIVHLPKGCKAKSVVKSGEKTLKLGRLVLDRTTIEDIYSGLIKNWKEVVAVQGEHHGSDSLTCTGGTAEEEMRIHPVVRLDKSGTTHIFKEFLALTDTESITMEAFNEIEEVSGKKVQPCKAALPEESKTWAEVGEGCENQRWPTAAEVTRPPVNETGNPGVIKQVAGEESSIGYADLAQARTEDEKAFTKKGVGGENKKGSETIQGEQNVKFWAEVQDTAVGAAETLYADPATNGDIEKAGNSNCAATLYVANKGEKSPPENTRVSWAKIKAEIVQKKYSVCGLTYVLALRQYLFYEKPLGLTEEASNKLATTTENYLLWVLSLKTEGGGKEINNHDFAPLSGTIHTKAETGVKEIGNKVA
jgi:ABC-type phosphate transport system substrate-binding protein